MLYRSLARRSLVVGAAALCLMASNVQAQTVTSTVPQAVMPGKAIDVKLRGGALAGPTQLWTSFPAEVALTPDLAGNGTNAAEVSYRLTVPADVGPGIYALRVATPTGISPLRLIAVDDLPSVSQVKPNQTLATAQSVTLPVAVDGAVDNLSHDFYKFTVAAGQRVAFEVLGRRMGSPIDPLLRVLDPKGREIAYSDDVGGLGPDCQFAYTFKDAGEYFVELRDIRWQGSAAHSYRLRMGDFPCVSVPYPMAVKKGAFANVAFAGSSVEGTQPVAFNLPGEATVNWLNLGARLPNGTSSGFATAAVVLGDQALEVEPNNEAANATRVELGMSLNGRFDVPGDVDRFVFTAKAGQHFVFSGITRSQGSPVDLDLTLLKPDGGQMAAADDVGASEGKIDFSAPADGDYTLVVRDLLRRGGSAFAYRIAVETFAPEFTLAVSTDTVNIEAGGAVPVTVTSVRGPVTGLIKLSLEGAPEGVTAAPAVIGPGLNSTVMTIHGAATVPAGKIYNLRIVGSSQLGAAEVKTVATVTDAQKVGFSGLQTPPPALAETISVGMNPAPLFVLKTDKPVLTFGKDLSATFKVQVVRAEGFGEEIALAILPPQNGVPGVTITPKPIAKGTNEVEIVVAANAQAPLGDFSVVLQGTGKLDKRSSVQPIPSLTLNLAAPYVLKPDFAGGTIAKGQTLKGKVVAERNPAYAGPITLTFQNLPKGVTAAPATIAAGQTEAEVVLTAAADAAVGAVPNVIVAGEGVNGAAKLPASSAATALTVQ